MPAGRPAQKGGSGTLQFQEQPAPGWSTSARLPFAASGKLANTGLVRQRRSTTPAGSPPALPRDGERFPSPYDGTRLPKPPEPEPPAEQQPPSTAWRGIRNLQRSHAHTS